MQDQLSTTFAALADPTRRAILARLALGETSVTELAKPFQMSLPAVSKHLKVLERAGLIVRGREAQWRPCRIEPAALKHVDDWLERYRRLWVERLDRLEAYLRELQAKGKKGGRRHNLEPKPESGPSSLATTTKPHREIIMQNATQASAKVQPYLFFDGRCEEAL